MIFWVLRQIIISFLFIFTMHNIYNYFKRNLTVPKIKDLIKKLLNSNTKIFMKQKKKL